VVINVEVVVGANVAVEEMVKDAMEEVGVEETVVDAMAVVEETVEEEDVEVHPVVLGLVEVEVAIVAALPDHKRIHLNGT